MRTKYTHTYDLDDIIPQALSSILQQLVQKLRISSDSNVPSYIYYSYLLTSSTLGFITVVSTVVLSIADVTAHHTVAIITLVLEWSAAACMC